MTRGKPMSMSRKITEGRGQGYGSKYKPWLYVHEVPSKGQVSRIKGWKTERPHHLMSQLEKNYFYLLEWDDNVVDIREQYPLLPVRETMSIASQLGFKHPVKLKTPFVMTTDFLVTYRAGIGNTLEAIAVKPSNQLDNRRTLQKLEIERQYWLKRNIPWKVVTENNMPSNLCRNIGYLHSKRNPANLPVDYLMIPLIKNRLKDIINDGSRQTLANNALAIDAELNLNPGTSLAVVRYLLATKQWHIDMSVLINPDRSLAIEF